MISFNCHNTIDSATNALRYLRCCLSSEFSSLVDKAYTGLVCSQAEWNKHILKQQMLKYLLCVDWTNLDYECLTTTELENLANYILTNCPDCSKQLN